MRPDRSHYQVAPVLNVASDVFNAITATFPHNIHKKSLVFRCHIVILLLEFVKLPTQIIAPSADMGNPSH